MSEINTGLTITGEHIMTHEEPLAEVRWFPRSMMQAHDLVLYQRWGITTYKDGRPCSKHTEWRRVEIGSPDDLRVP